MHTHATKFVRLAVPLAVAAVGLLPAALAATIVQNFDTGQISPGSNTETDWNINQFDTGLGTLTGITLSAKLETWDGSYSIQNTTSPSALVTGTMHQGVSSTISGLQISLSSLDTTLAAGQSKNFSLPANGDSDSVVGPTYANRTVAGPNVGSVSSSWFGLYEGTGTYAVKFYSSQANSSTASGSVAFNGTSAWSEGFLTVTYTYTAVPEPATMAMLAGIGLLGFGLMRRRLV